MAENPGKCSMDTHVAVLHSKQVNNLLESLYEEGVLPQAEYDRCIAKSTRVERCRILAEVLGKKEGGIEKLKTTLESIPPHGKDTVDEEIAEVPPPPQADKNDEDDGNIFIINGSKDDYTSILAEKDKTISDLRTENELLKKQLKEKTEELEALKKARYEEDRTDAGDNASGSHDTEKVRTMEMREESAKKQSIAYMENITALQKENFELKKKVSNLSDEISENELSMEVVKQIQNIYPYIKEVLGCRIHHIPGDEAHERPLQCLEMMFDLANTNTRCCQIIHNSLINTPVNIGSINGFKRYQGTSGSILITPALSSTTTLPPPLQYWESHNVVQLTDRLLSFQTLFEVGVCEEGWVDKMTWVYKQPRSWCIRVSVCRAHKWGICTQIWANQRQQGLCHTHAMSNTPRKTSTISYGVVVDVGKGKIVFLDLSKGRILHTFSVKCEETLFPVFAVEPWLDHCSVEMKLNSGYDNMTENKKHLIQKALR